jgi:ABC-type sugar transport system permease subunit
MDIERLFSSMKIGKELVEIVAKMINEIYDIVNRSGVQMLIFLAGLQSISPAIY